MDFYQKMVLLTVLTAATCQNFDPYSAGPHSVVRIRLNSTIYSPGLPVHLSAWAPAESGVYPIIYFFTGFQAVTPVEIYSDVLERIATHGYVIAAPWNLTDVVRPEDKLDAMQQVFYWTYDNLDPLLIEAGAASDMMTDYETAFAMSHSSGAHLICSYLQLKSCENFKGLALTSPVDGIDPFGVIEDYCTSTESTLNFSIPAVVMAAGLDDNPGGNGNLSCAPAEMSNRRFYNALDPQSPRWFLNATEFGHMDYTDYFSQGFNELVNFCAANEEAGIVEFSNYRNFISGTAVSFFFSLLQDDCQAYIQYLQDTGLMPVDVYGEHVNPWESTGDCPRGYCSPVLPTFA